MYLSCSEQDLICGNFLGDFLKNHEILQLPEGWKRGITLHRKIDSFTDNHINVKACTRLLHKTQGKYSPVVIDILFDYILFLNWNHYSGITFEKFELQVYNTLEQNIPLFPERVRSTTQKMVKGRFLRSYTSTHGLEYTFERLKSRLKFKSNIDKAVEDLLNNQDSLNHNFNIFFPEVIILAESYCQC